jgi:Mg2+ and Co2+ transporter CorA
VLQDVNGTLQPILCDAIPITLQGASTDIVFLSSKINFLLDTTLGCICLQQNQIIKIFSVAAVIFLPPTLPRRSTA